MPETTARRAILPPIDAIKERLFGGFATSNTTEDEYAVTAYCTEGELDEVLHELGFSASLFSSLGVSLGGNVEDGSWVRRESFLADEQLHVVTHDREDSGIDVYAHEELSKITHPVAHYRKVDYDAEAGVERFRDMLEEYWQTAEDPPKYEVHPPHHRSWAWALHLLSFVSTPTAVRVGRAAERFESKLASRFSSGGV